jgi:UPF0716 protein FxsA
MAKRLQNFSDFTLPDEAGMNISQWVLLAVLSLPILEIYLLIKLVGALGFLLTLALLLGAAGLGGFLLRIQGWTTWIKVQQALARGELPAREMLESALIGAGGVLLLVPGFISDILALFCLIPATRRQFAEYLLRHHIPRPARPAPHRTADEPRVIEGEYKREE